MFREVHNTYTLSEEIGIHEKCAHCQGVSANAIAMYENLRGSLVSTTRPTDQACMGVDICFGESR